MPQVRRNDKGEDDAAAAQPAAAQTPPPLPADEETAEATTGEPLAADDSGRQKVPREQIIRRSEQWLGIPQHVMIGALASDDREELTLNAAEKAVEKFRGTVVVAEDEEE